MPATIIESALTGKLEKVLLIKWLNNESIEDKTGDCVLFCCNKNEFVAYFLSYLRNQTDSILQTNTNAIQILHQSTPEKFLTSCRKHKRSISDPTNDDCTKDSLSVKNDRHSTHESPNKERRRGRKVKTKLFNEDSNQTISSDESRLSIGVEKLVISSTPLKNGHHSDSPNLLSPVTPNWSYHERCDTPRLNHRHSRSQEKNCLGDYITVNIKSSKKKKPVKSDSDIVALELDINNSEMFPEIGSKKTSSVKSEKRRIKPTNIDKNQKSLSLNNFTSECFQQPSPLALEDNVVFKHQKLQLRESSNSFEVERNILKQERHKLMEKFNILNTSSSPKSVLTPQIKVTQKESFEKAQNYIKADINKVLFKDKIDIIIEIYGILLRNNLILSVNTEIYYLISILISKQVEDDCLSAENKLKDNNIESLLKTIHNSTYFAVKSLWNLRTELEVVLDKNSLKTLGENKRVRSFYPDLAKFLLNCYGLRCEAESNQEKPRLQENRPANDVICFNIDTDNADNFPSMQSFQNFKKQRDMFYEIVRWYQEVGAPGVSGVGGVGGVGAVGVGTRSSFRARVKALVGAGAVAANHKHLSALLIHHLKHQAHHTQESKMSKLQRRLTFPNAPESHRLPHFTEKELFYKEFIINAENENFRVHLRDALSSEILTLDSAHISVEDRGNIQDVSKEYLSLCKKLTLLAKFLGFMTSLPYCQSIEYFSKTNSREFKDQKYVVPKEKVLENDIALRNYCQPNIDLKGVLTNAFDNGRLSITLPWIVHYLSMLDYTTLRIKYYQDLIKTLFDIYMKKLTFTTENNLKKTTVIVLKSILGWLFDLPHFPQELFYEERSVKCSVVSESNIDCIDLIDESIIFDLCPYLREVNVLLSTCRVTQEQKESTYRHITPISLSLKPEDRIRNKERELQNRLEEELLKSQPSSTRRVLELVIERVTSASVKELTATALLEAQEQAREQARCLLLHRNTEDSAILLRSLQSLYSEQLLGLRARALQSAGKLMSSRASGALGALLPTASAALHALAGKAARNRLAKWLANNWSSTAILCKDIETEMKTLLALGELASAAARRKSTPDSETITAPGAQFEADNISPSSCIIMLKDQVCLLLDGEEPDDMTSLLAGCATSCSPNNLFGRAATQRAILQLSVDLCIVYVSRKPNEITDGFLEKLYAIWNTCCPDRKQPPPLEVSLPERREDLSPEFRNFDDEERAHTPLSDEEPVRNIKIVISNLENPDQSQSINSESKQTPSKLVLDGPESKTTTQESVFSPLQESKTENNLTLEENVELLEFFDRILCPRNIVILSTSKEKCSDVWQAMATVLVYLLTHNFLSEDSLTEQCLAVYRQDWPQSTLESLSTCMKSVSSRWSRSSTGKFTLFLEFLAEYCGDMDYEPAD